MLDLGGSDAVAGRRDHVVLAADVPEIAVLILHAEIAGQQKFCSVFFHRGFRIFPVLDHGARTGVPPPVVPPPPGGSPSPRWLTIRTSNPGVALPIEPGLIGNSFELLPITRLHSVWPNTSWASMPNVARTQSSNSPPSDSPPVKMLRNLTPSCLTPASRISFSAVGGRNTLRMWYSAIICIAAWESNFRARWPTIGTP